MYISGSSDEDVKVMGTRSFIFYIHRIVAGEGDRPTRFHDERGNRVSASGLLYAPHALFTTILRKYLGYRPITLWISYDAKHVIARVMRSDWKVLEFGSGMSTLWLAQRCGELYSIEHSAAWHSTVQKRLCAMGIRQVSCFLRDEATYPDLSGFRDHFFDLVLIDGIRRTDCALNALRKVKHGGWVYLDNTDAEGISCPNGDCQQAEQVLLNACKHGAGTVSYFTGFAPTSFWVTQGMLVHMF
jgi:hypothetical protein